MRTSTRDNRHLLLSDILCDVLLVVEGAECVEDHGDVDGFL
jgi:hypothetical protein